MPSLMKKMRERRAIVQMAVYDYRSAVVADRHGTDVRSRIYPARSAA